MLYFILGVFLGVVLMFFARLADKDITRIVERYERTGSVLKKKPIIIKPSETPKSPDEFIRELNGEV